ncbi:PdaC/SigV domain-containing protein [Paenibacillus sp. sgz5001063]|uniref:PdaC/SigV domain-containing protein n=1 Tax=Paenibacillus sp. sgz5001063 TaxID=3242474 RepID=UPI0036D2AE49
MKNIKKKQAHVWGAGIMAAGILLSGGLLPAETSQAASATVQTNPEHSLVVLKVNGKITPQTGIVREGKVWVPVTFLRDSLGMQLTYDKTEQAYTIGKGISKVKLSVTDYEISISVNNFYINEYQAVNINNRLFVPLDLLNDFLGYKGDWSASTGRLNVISKAQNAITIKTESIVKDREDAPIKLDYPQISGLANAKAQQTINDTIKQTFTKFAAGAEKEIANKSSDDRPYEFDGGYVITYNQDGILSLITNQYSYLGGAHGMTYRNAFTFSLKDGKRLLIGDLLKANPNYKKELNAKLSKLIKAEGGYLGGFTGLNTEKNFYVKDGRLAVFFQLYEYTAYASGFPEYEFTFKELLPDGSSPFAGLK